MVILRKFYSSARFSLRKHRIHMEFHAKYVSSNDGNAQYPIRTARLVQTCTDPPQLEQFLN